jgi:eukaryotic-like serine/threonine-protein kinase
MTEATLLGGRYEIREQLGVGGMAEVYRGRDTRLGRDVAVKVLRDEFVNDPTFIARFRREAQSAAALNHPNIVSVYDTGDDKGAPFIVMEYVEGRTLRDCLRAEGRLTSERAMEVVADVCAALEYSHGQGIIHRDIKPANVMLTPAGTVKVMDFGIARAVTTQTVTQTAAVIGTAQYLSPEQARGEHVDARSDVYSTGCLLYELLTHTPPFTGDSPVAVAYQHVREDPELPSRRAPGITPAVDAVVMKALAKNPGNRYQTAGEMREDLLRAAAGRAVAATPILGDAAATTFLTPAASTMVLTPTPPADERRRGRGLAYAGLALATLLVFVVAAIIARNAFDSGGGSIAVPDLKGRTEAQARQALEQLGLRVGDVEQRFVERGNPAKPGTIIEQDPIAQIRVDEGAAVDIVVSKGVEQVRVPALERGERIEDYEGKLRSVGLVLKRTDVPNDAARGTVLKITPAPNTTVDKGSEVAVEVADGTVQVPELVNLSEAEARRICQEQKLDCAAKRQVDDSVPPGTVIAQDKAPGSRISRSDTITLTISEAPSPSPTPSESPSESPSPSDSPSPSVTIAP